MEVDWIEMGATNFDGYADRNDGRMPTTYLGFHETVIPLVNPSASRLGSIAWPCDLSNTERKVERVCVMAVRDTTRDVRVEVEARLDFNWGSKDGFKVDGQVSGKIKDGKNYVEGKVNQDFGGEGHANFSAGYEGSLSGSYERD